MPFVPFIAVGVMHASMYSEMNHGCEELPVFLSKAGSFLKYAATAVAPILSVSADANANDNLLECSVFEILVSTLDLMNKIEDS